MITPTVDKIGDTKVGNSAGEVLSAIAEATTLGWVSSEVSMQIRVSEYCKILYFRWNLFSRSGEKSVVRVNLFSRWQVGYMH